MANNTFVKTVIRHPLAVGIIAPVVVAVLGAALEQWVGPWQILGAIWRWSWEVIVNIPTWIWYGGGLVCAFVLGGYVVALLITRSPHQRQQLSNMAGITTPVVSMGGGIPLDGCVAFYRLDRTFHFLNPYLSAKVYEAVVKIDSDAATRLKQLVPPKAADYYPAVQQGFRLAVSDSFADMGYVLRRGACLGCRGRESDHIGFIFAFAEEHII